MTFSFKLEAKPPWRDLRGRFVKASSNIQDSLRKELTAEGKNLVRMVGTEARGGQSGTIGKGVSSRTFAGGDRVELRIYVNQIGKWHLSGTGIYGPLGKVIRPTHARVLHFFIDGQEFFRPWVRGVKPDPFVERGYRNWLPGARAMLQRIAKEWITTVKKG